MDSRAERMRFPDLFCIALLRHLNAHGAGEPSIMLIAASIVSAVQILHFCCAISLTCAFDT